MTSKIEEESSRTVEIHGFDWDAGNTQKVQRHGLSLSAIERVFFGQVWMTVDKKHSRRERWFIAVGETSENRPVFVVFTFRIRHGLFLIRVISARAMHQKERKHYERIKEKK